MMLRTHNFSLLFAAPAGLCGTAAPPAGMPTGGRVGTAACARRWVRRGGQRRSSGGRLADAKGFLCCALKLCRFNCFAVGMHAMYVLQSCTCDVDTSTA